MAIRLCFLLTLGISYLLSNGDSMDGKDIKWKSKSFGATATATIPIKYLQKAASSGDPCNPDDGCQPCRFRIEGEIKCTTVGNYDECMCECEGVGCEEPCQGYCENSCEAWNVNNVSSGSNSRD